MTDTPTVNPDPIKIADAAKHAYAVGTKEIADLAYRLAELAGTGQLNPNEAMRLQEGLRTVLDALYAGTLCAVRDWETEDSTWDNADNTYSDGRQVLTQIQIEPAETADRHWEHNRFLLDDVVWQHPREMICYIARLHPDTERE